MGKRHLPVLSGSPSEPQAPTPAWLWSFLGGLVTIATWAPLALIITVVLGRVAPPSNAAWPRGLMVVGGLAFLSTFACSCALGGALVGRFCEQPTSAAASISGVWGLSFVLLLAALGNALRPAPVGVVVAVCLLTVAWPCATLGGRWGKRRRAACGVDDGDHVQSAADRG